MRGFNILRFTSRKILFTTALLAFVVLPLAWSWYSRTSLTRNPITIPPKTAFDVPVSNVPHASTIALAARIDLREVQAELDAAIPPIIADFSGERGGCLRARKLGIKISIGCRWNGQVTRRGPLSLSGAGEALNFSIPVHAWVTVRNRSGPTVRQTVRADFTVTATARPTIGSEWNLDPNMSFELKWDKKPTIRLFNLIDISITRHVEPTVKEQLREIESKFKEQVTRLRLRETVRQMWEAAHEPIRVSEEPDIWLSLAPQAVGFSGIRVKDNVLTLKLGMKSESTTMVGKSPTAPDASPLPQLEEYSIDDPVGFLLRLPVIVQYDALRRAVEVALRAGEQWMPIDSSGILLTIEQVEVYPSNPNLVVGLHFTADLPNKILDTRGVVYLHGKLEIDNENKMLRVEEFGLTAATDNALANAANLIFGEALRKQIQDALVIDFRSDYERLLVDVRQDLNRDLDRGVSISGNLNSIRAGEVLVLEKGLRLISLADGVLEITYGLQGTYRTN